jgi:hypothetical protein
VALFLDRSLTESAQSVRTPSSEAYVEYNFGPALTATVENVVAAQYETVARVAQPACEPPATLLLECRLPRAPAVQVRWVARMFTVDGGAAAEIAVSCDARTCDGHLLWERVAVGYGSADHAQGIANVPDEEEFQPGVDAALQDLAAQLSAMLITADGGAIATPSTQGGVP